MVTTNLGLCADCCLDFEVVDVDCNGCTDTMPKCWEFSMAGITGCSACSGWNGTFILEHDSTGDCNASIVFNAGCTFCMPVFDGAKQVCQASAFSRYQFLYNSSQDEWRLHAFDSNDGVQYARWGIAPDDFDCLGANTLDLDFTAPSPPCDDWPSTVILEPVNCP